MSRPARGGLTLLEVLVTLGILVLTICLLLPATRRVRVAAGRSTCENQLKQVIIALHGFESSEQPKSSPWMGHRSEDTEGSFPTGCIGPGTTPEERFSWMVAVLPFIEEVGLFHRFDFDQGYGGNLPVAQTRVKTFVCPLAKHANTGDAVTNYLALAGIGRSAPGQPAGAAGNGFMGDNRVTKFSIIEDGLSNTIALMETRFGIGPWARGGATNLRGFDPADVPLHGDQRPFGGHPKIMLAAMADGSIRSIRNSIDPAQLAQAITIAGGEPVNLD
jgi:hypothetical protein